MKQSGNLSIDKSRSHLFEAVLVALEQLREGRGPALLAFWGSKGIGKTELLSQIVNQLVADKKATLIDILDIEQQDLEKIEATVQKALARIPQKQTLIVCLDNLDYLLRSTTDSHSFFDFERDTILPAIEQGNALILVTSQIEITQWREDEVRARQITYHVPPLTLDEVAALLSSVNIEAEKIYQLTFGQPEVARWLSENPALSEKDIADKAYRYFLEDIPSDAREIEDFICLLPMFNIFLLQMIMNRKGFPETKTQYVDCLERIKEFIRRGIVYWDVSVGGAYRFSDTAVRRLLARRVSYHNSASFKEIHQIASDYYQTESKSPGYLHMHLVSAIYHLAQTKRDLSQQEIGQYCLEWVRGNLNSWLSARWDDVIQAWETGANEPAVIEELKELIGQEYYNEIAQQLEKAKQTLEVTE